MVAVQDKEEVHQGCGLKHWPQGSDREARPDRAPPKGQSRVKGLKVLMKRLKTM
jgi:hypothetical protein